MSGDKYVLHPVFHFDFIFKRRFYQELHATFFPRITTDVLPGITRDVFSRNFKRHFFQEIHAALLPRITRGVASKNCTRRCFQELHAALLPRITFLHSYIIILYVYNYKILYTDNDIRFILRVPLLMKNGAIIKLVQMDDSSYRLICYLDKKDEIYYHSSKEHPKISKIAKFGCEML
jgi:hypothetical protein